MNKQIIILIISVVSFITTPLGAQESCYEEYLREHNMKILTAEDADDSYDELKKTVLAKQMYGDSYLLMVDTIAKRTMITKVDGTYIADVHVALVDSTWYMWLSVDPLADKNIANTPYMYCNGNPIMLIDPNGRDSISVTYNSKTSKWDIGNIVISQGNDVVSVTGKDENTASYEFSEGEYGKRASFLNLENTGEGGYTLGVYHVSGAKDGGTGFYITPGGEASNEDESGRRIIEDTYPIVAPFEKARWLFPGVGGKAVMRGCRFHWGDGVAKDWTDGCFVLFTNYTLDQARNICITENNSKITAVNFAHLLGGVGTANSSYKGRTGVLNFQYGIQDKLVLKSIWKR